MNGSDTYIVDGGNGFYFILFSFLFFWGVYHRSKSSKLAQPEIPGSIFPPGGGSVRPDKEGDVLLLCYFRFIFA